MSGNASPEPGACVEKTVAELAFWRRVHEGEFRDRVSDEALIELDEKTAQIVAKRF